MKVIIKSMRFVMRNITTKRNSNLPIFTVMLCLFYVIGFACGVALYVDYDKIYGVILAMCIAPALIYHAYRIVKWVLTIKLEYALSIFYTKAIKNNPLNP